MDAPLVPITLAFALGILLECTIPHLVLTGSILAGLLLLVTRRWRQRRRRLIGLLLLWVCVGCVRAIVWRVHPSARLATQLSDEPQRVQLHGVVSDDPTTMVSDHDRLVQRCVMDLRHVRGERGWRSAGGRLQMMLEAPRQPLAYGDELLIDGEWSRVPAPTNPGQHDGRAALVRERIHGRLRVGPSDRIVLLRRSQGRPWRAVVLQFRHRCEALIRATFGEPEAGLLLALLLGERVALDAQLKDAFVETGTVHLLVVSGFNVGLIAGLFELCWRLLGIPWRMRLLLIACGLGGYGLLIGWQPPVARAIIMAWMILGAYALDRVVSWWNALAAAALAILWLNPSQLFDPGFQLSFSAVASLLLFTPSWAARFERGCRWLRPAWLRRYVALSLSATSAIWVGLAPLLAWYFHLVAPVSVLANLLIAPLVSALVAVGSGGLLMGTIVTVVFGWGHGLLSCLLHATLRCVTWCHAVPGGYWYVARPSAMWLAGYYGLIAVSLSRMRLRLTAPGLVMCWLLGLTMWVWSTVALRALEARWLRVDFLDVGHGDCIVVRLPRGHTLLVDTGTQAAGRARLIPYLRAMGITTIDALLLTHTDEDHLGGAIPLLQTMRVKRVLTNGVRGDTASAQEVLRLVATHQTAHTILSEGLTLRGEPSVELRVLHPPPGLVPGVAAQSNDNCVVLKLTDGAVSVLLTGDIEEAGLPWLLREGDVLRSTVLKIPHHGSRLGIVGARFFAAVQPRLAILSVGRLHHLPASETLRAIERTGARLYSTRADGAVQLRTDGTRLEIRTLRSPQRESWSLHVE